MSPQIDWEAKAKGFIKAELKQRAITYEQLSMELAMIGVHESPAAIANKISRGRFTCVFFLQCLTAIGCNVVHLEKGRERRQPL